MPRSCASAPFPAGGSPRDERGVGSATLFERPRGRAATSGNVTQNVAPLSGARALGANRAAVQIDDVANDGEAEAEAAEQSRRRAVLLREAIEDVRQELGLDAAALVAHTHRRVAVDASSRPPRRAHPAG